MAILPSILSWYKCNLWDFPVLCPGCRKFKASAHLSFCQQGWLLITQTSSTQAYLDSKVQGAYMGPTWGRQDPGGLHVCPMNLAIRVTACKPWQNTTKINSYIYCLRWAVYIYLFCSHVVLGCMLVLIAVWLIWVDPCVVDRSISAITGDNSGIQMSLRI